MISCISSTTYKHSLLLLSFIKSDPPLCETTVLGIPCKEYYDIDLTDDYKTYPIFNFSQCYCGKSANSIYEITLPILIILTWLRLFPPGRKTQWPRAEWRIWASATYDVISSDNGLSPVRKIVNWTVRNKLQWNLNRNLFIFIQEIAFKNVVREMTAFLSRPQCVNTGRAVSLTPIFQLNGRNLCFHDES